MNKFILGLCVVLVLLGCDSPTESGGSTNSDNVNGNGNITTTGADTIVFRLGYSWSWQRTDTVIGVWNDSVFTNLTGDTTYWHSFDTTTIGYDSLYNGDTLTVVKVDEIDTTFEDCFLTGDIDTLLNYGESNLFMIQDTITMPLCSLINFESMNSICSTEGINDVSYIDLVVNVDSVGFEYPFTEYATAKYNDYYVHYDSVATILLDDSTVYNNTTITFPYHSIIPWTYWSVPNLAFEFRIRGDSEDDFSMYEFRYSVEQRDIEEFDKRNFNDSTIVEYSDYNMYSEVSEHPYISKTETYRSVATFHPIE